MKIAPLIDQSALKARLATAYGLNVASFTFVPEGELSIAYIVHCADGSRYFAKLLPNNQLVLAGRENLDTYLAITYELHHRLLLTSVVAPLPTLDGRLRAEFDTMPLILFPYIAGNNLPLDSDTWTAQARHQLARDLAALHLATQRLHASLPTTSAFDTSYTTDIARALADLDKVGANSRPSQQQLRDLLMPHRDEVLAQLDHLRDLQHAAISKQPSLALCHTDIHGLNLIADPQGYVHILDWENVTLAPVEHDLQAFTASHFADFLLLYWQAGGIRNIDVDQFAFYNYYRYLGDMTLRLIRILYENNDPAQDAHDLLGIQLYCLDKLTAAEDELTQIGIAIQSAQQSYR